MTYLSTTLFLISLSVNWFLWLRMKRKQKELTTDARELLHYLTRGGGVVRVEILDPTKLLLYKGE